MIRTELIRKLITTLHLNVPERQMLDGPIRKSELVASVREMLLELGILLCPIGELTSLGGNRFQLFREVEVSFARYQEVRQEFETVDEAARSFVQLIVDDYPSGSIDGLVIEE